MFAGVSGKTMRDDQITIRRAEKEDMARVKELMDRVKQGMEHPDWYVTDEMPWLLRHVSEEGFTLLAETGDGCAEPGKRRLAAFFVVDLPGVRELAGTEKTQTGENLGVEAGLDEEDCLLVAHMDSVAVDPEFRGHHLQGRLVEAAERELAGRRQRFLMCTVHPENHASLHTMESHGYRVIATKEKYGGTLRHILLKEKENGKEHGRRRVAVLVSACLLGAECRYNEKGVLDERVRALMEIADLIPVCPEIFGGLPTPRVPAERIGDRVQTREGNDVTAQYEKGAREACRLAGLFSCSCAVLKERSPSCGHGRIYDGTHSKKLTDGNGVTAELLMKHGIFVFGESETEACREYIISKKYAEMKNFMDERSDL